MAETYSAGIVTAYGAARRGGYTGTYEEFCIEQAGFAEAAQQVRRDKESVEQTVETFSEETVPEAVQSVTDEGTRQVGLVTDAGDDAVEAVENAGTENVSSVNRAGSAKVEAVNNAGTTQVGNVNQAGATQVQAVEDKGEEVLESIPADYTALDAKVTSLSDSIGVSETVSAKVVNGTPANYGNAYAVTADEFIDASYGDVFIVSTNRPLSAEGNRYGFWFYEYNGNKGMTVEHSGWAARTDHFAIKKEDTKFFKWAIVERNAADTQYVTLRKEDFDGYTLSAMRIKGDGAVSDADSNTKTSSTILNRRIDNLHGYIAYHSMSACDTIVGNGLELKREYTEYVLNGKASAPFVVNINGTLIQQALPNRTMAFEAGRKYRTVLTKISGEASGASAIPGVSVYRPNESNSIGESWYDEKVYTRVFTAEENNSGYALCLYIPNGLTAADYRFSVTLEDITDEIEIAEENLSTISGELFSTKTDQQIWEQGGWARSGAVLDPTGSYHSQYICGKYWTIPDEITSIEVSSPDLFVALFAWDINGFAGFVTNRNGEPVLTKNTGATIMILNGYPLDNLRDKYPAVHFRVEVGRTSGITPADYGEIILHYRRFPIEVKQYFKSELDDTVAKIKAKQDEPSLVFLLSTDIHYESVTGNTFDRMIANMQELEKQVRVDGIWCLGDMTDGNTAQNITAMRANRLFEQFRKLDAPLFFAAGNHDCNNYSGAPIFTTAQVYQNFYSNMRNDVVLNFDALGTSYYYDYDNYKIRVISLDIANTESSATHYRYPAGTVEWFSQILPQTPSGYTVILLEHMSPIAAQNWNDTVPSNASGINTAITAWLADTAHTLVQFCGHSHADYSIASPYLTIVTNCQKYEGTTDYVVTQEMRDQGTDLGVVGAQHWARQAGTITEDCWDAVVIRPNSRKIDMIRFGAGVDRSFTY